MIEHIRIKNFAIIENAEVDFYNGLNIITGETGAGKSIVVEAVSLVLGARADTSMIRTGCDKAVVQLLGTLDGEEVVITRELSVSGKNVCRLNGEIITLGELNGICSRIADIHGQYDNQSLLNPDNHIRLLDTYRRADSSAVKSELSENYHRYSEVKKSLTELLAQEKENRRRKDFWEFELNEIKKADLKPGEDTELEERISLLKNSEKIFESVSTACESLDGEGGSVLSAVSLIDRSLSEVSEYSGKLKALSAEMSDMYYRLSDAAVELNSLRESMTFSPGELDAAISRLNVLDDLKKKYGTSIENILEYKSDLEGKLSGIETFSKDKEVLEAELKSAKRAFLNSCHTLSEIRTLIAKDLETRITRELKDLNFPDAVLQIAVSPAETANENGMDKVEILISANKGEPLKPLSKIASGGEMSRVMLAFKNVISGYDGIPTLIFDEIDTGISGITASVVGSKLKEIARSHQIICITHLPQIAACGEHNYRIAKKTEGDSTFTNVLELDEDGKIADIARLLGGANITGTTLLSARELIESSK